MHAQIEEEVFYPAVRKAVPDAASLLDEAQDEHQEVKDLDRAHPRAWTRPARRWTTWSPSSPASVEHHVKEERDELFPKARSAPGMDLVALGQQLKERQQELTQRDPGALTLRSRTPISRRAGTRRARTSRRSR